jgi:hypothetical protein
MPKVLLYTTAKIVWTFLFYGTDVNENRAHVHVGKKDTQDFAKIWLEPEVELAKEGDLTDAQLKQLLEIAEENKCKLLKQWQVFKNGGNVRIIKINK